jgi:parallel beta-helix repeat protein
MRSALHQLGAGLAVACVVVGGCGGGNGGGADPTATRRSGTPTNTPTRGGNPQATSTPTPGSQGTRTRTTPGGQMTRTHTPTPGGEVTRSPTGGSSEPQTLYVRESGNDDNPGTSPDAALRTMTRVAQMLRPGTTVHVGPGEYVGRIAISGVAGTAALPVEILADEDGSETGDAPGAVTLDAGGATAALVITRSPFLTIDGFVIRGALPQTTPERVAATGIGLRTESDDVTIRNCVIVNDGSSDGIRVDASNRVLVFNNLLFQNDRGILITGDSQGTRVINNTIAVHQRNGIAVTQRAGVAPSDTEVVNNVIQGNENNLAISVDEGPPSSVPGYSGDFNLAFEPGLEDQSTIYRPAEVRGEADVNADALFVNAEQGDVHLDPASPAIDAGTDTIGPALVNALRQRGTEPDGAADVGAVDMGYHYPR